MELNESLLSLSGLEELELNFSKHEFKELSDYVTGGGNGTINILREEENIKLTGEYFNNLSQILMNLPAIKKLYIIIE